MVTTSALRSLVTDYLVGAMDLADFEEAVTTLAWCIPPDERSPRADLAAGLLLRLSEHQRGHWDRDELDEMLFRQVGYIYHVTPLGMRLLPGDDTDVTRFSLDFDPGWTIAAGSLTTVEFGRAREGDARPGMATVVTH